jgi:hypothetical protein
MPVSEKWDNSSKSIPLKDAKGARPTTKLKTGPANPRLNIEIQYSQVKDGTKFSAASVGLPAALVKDTSEEKRREIYRDAFLDQVQGKVTSEKDIEQGRCKGKDYMVDTAKGKMRMQLLMLGGAGCYAMVEADTAERLAASDVDTYFASFKMKEMK